MGLSSLSQGCCLMPRQQGCHVSVGRLRAMSPKKPSRCKLKRLDVASNTSQFSSTVISLFLSWIVTKVPVAILILLTTHCWAMPPVFTVNNASSWGCLISGKPDDCFGAASSLSSNVRLTQEREGSTYTQRTFSSVQIDQYTDI